MLRRRNDVSTLTITWAGLVRMSALSIFLSQTPNKLNKKKNLQVLSSAMINPEFYNQTAITAPCTGT
jgi:hypothetical protein